MSVRSDTGPFAIVPEWLLLSEASANAIRLYGILGLYADKDGTCFPRRKLLAEQMGCSVRTIATLIGELHSAGALKIRERRREDGGRSSNEYTLIRTTPGKQLSLGPVKQASLQELDPVSNQTVSTYVLTAQAPDSSEKTPLDLLWDACEEHVQKAPVTKAARSAYAKLVRELFAADVTPEQIREQARRYRQHPTLGKTALSLAALAKWGNELEHRRRTSAPSNGHVEEPVEVLSAEENIHRMQELRERLSLKGIDP